MAKFKLDIEDLTFDAMRKTIGTMIELIAVQDLENDKLITGDLRTDYKLMNDAIQNVTDSLTDSLV